MFRVTRLFVNCPQGLASLVNTTNVNARRSFYTASSRAAVAFNVPCWPCLRNDDKWQLTAAQQYVPSRAFAARKGTRTRKAAKIVKKVVEEKKLSKKLQKLAAMPYIKQRPLDESLRLVPVDDVFFYRHFKTRKYSFDEIIKFLRESHHPTVYNAPNAPVYIRLNMDMKYPNRVTKCMGGWKSIVEMKDPFLLEGMTAPKVLAFCIEDIDYIENVTKVGGADLAGGKEIIKGIQTGDINADEFEYIVAHPSVIPDLTAIRGLIKKRFPMIKTRTVSTDLVTEIKRLKSGIRISVIKDDREPDFGFIETPIGTLDMDGLLDNFMSVLKDTLSKNVKGKSANDFIISCVVKTPDHGFEEFNLDTASILEETMKPSTNTETVA